MERLTCGNFDGQCDHHTMAIDGCFNKTEDRFMLCEDCINKKRYDKLKQYEDLEKAGLLVRLPCKVGDWIYYVFKYNGIEKYRVEGFKMFECETDGEWYVETNKNAIHIEDFGDRAFLIREEAEKRLEELQK